jgi:hypothetical protein
MTSDGVYAKASDKNTWDSGSAQFDWSALAEGALQALSDLGAVVLMPVKAKDLKDDETVFALFAERWYLSDLEHNDPELILYVNALEGDQS